MTIGRFLLKLQMKVEDWLTLTSAGVVAFMMVITTIDVIMRRGFHAHLKGSYEFVMLAFVFVIFFGLAYSQRQDKHIIIPILYERLSQRARHIVEGAVLVICLVLFVTITWVSAQSAWFNFQAGDTILGAIPVLTWPSRVVIPIGSGLLSLRFLVQLVRLIRRGQLYEEAVAAEEIKI